MKCKNNQETKYKFDKSPSVKVAIQDLSKNGIFKEKLSNSSKINHHAKNPFSLSHIGYV